jgi:hypothetical protein
MAESGIESRDAPYRSPPFLSASKKALASMDLSSKKHSEIAQKAVYEAAAKTEQT